MNEQLVLKILILTAVVVVAICAIGEQMKWCVKTGLSI